jgi:predicted glycosyltransferase
MFGKEKGPTRKWHTEHAEEARRHLQQAGGGGDGGRLAKANLHATLAVYTLLSERLPAPKQPQP